MEDTGIYILWLVSGTRVEEFWRTPTQCSVPRIVTVLFGDLTDYWQSLWKPKCWENLRPSFRNCLWFRRSWNPRNPKVSFIKVSIESIDTLYLKTMNVYWIRFYKIIFSCLLLQWVVVDECRYVWKTRRRDEITERVRE